MFKLKLVSKPKVMKLKCNFSFPNIVLANLQKKEVVPSEEVQKIVADVPYDGLSEVVIDKIPDEYVIPSGTINIAENGVYDVTDKAEANVNIQLKLQEKEKTIVENGTSVIEPDENFDGLSKVTINVDTPVVTLGTKTITENGVYKAEDDDLGGYSEITVETSGVDINEYFIKNLVGPLYTQPKIIMAIKKIPKINYEDNCSYLFYNLRAVEEIDVSGIKIPSNSQIDRMFADCQKLQKIDVSNFDTSNVTTIHSIFSGCKELTELDLSKWNTSNFETISYAFSACIKLITLNLNGWNLSKVKSLNSLFYSGQGNYALKNIYIENHNLGAAFLTTVSENYSNYTLDMVQLRELTHESLMNIINGLHDIKTAGVKPQSLRLGAINLAKLTSEQIAIATNKGWTVN